MVMLVFTLPSFPYVFKVIRDHFAPPKDMDRATVKQKYLLVKYHDRVGRLADTLEYSLVALPLERFDPALVEELKAEAASNIEFEGDRIVIKHVYIERRMQPLNLYLAEAAQDGDDARFALALAEYGNAIKDLAGANIFPGDMLLKNFGVTRNNRVVFYDYDEIAYMTDCNFRAIPPPSSYEDEMAAEPYWSIGANDVFPSSSSASWCPIRARGDLSRPACRPELAAILAGQAAAHSRRPAGRRLPLPRVGALQAVKSPAARPRRCASAISSTCSSTSSTSGERSKLAIGGTKRRIGARKGRVIALKIGATGEYGFSHDSSTCTSTAKIRMYRL
jgi:hypothetical protein